MSGVISNIRERIHTFEVHAFADGELSPDDAEAFRLHLGTCTRCQAELGQVLQLQAMASQLRQPEPAAAGAAAAVDGKARLLWGGLALATLAALAALLHSGLMR